MERVVFISYRRSGKNNGTKKAELFYERLAKTEFIPFLDTEDLYVGYWDEQIEENIEKSSFFLAIISEGYLERIADEKSVIRREVDKALERKMKLIASFDGVEDTDPRIDELVKKNKEYMKLFFKAQRVDNPDELVSKIAKAKPDLELRKLSSFCANKIERLQENDALFFQQNDDEEIERTIRFSDNEVYRINVYQRQDLKKKLVIPDKEEIIKTQLHEMLDNHPFTCIYNDGGAGKTFLMHKIFELLKDNATYIPIYENLKDIAFSDGNSIIPHFQQQVRFAEEWDVKLNHLKENNTYLVILLDGFNEIKNDEENKLNNAISSIKALKKGTNVRVILTGRYIPEGLSKIFSNAKIEGISDRDICEYLEKENFVVDKDSILRLPLYLKLYKQIISNDKSEDAVDRYNTKFRILRKAFQDDRDKKDYSDEQIYASSCIVPYVCYRMTSIDDLKIKDDDITNLTEDYDEAVSEIIDRPNICRLFERKFEYDGFPIRDAGFDSTHSFESYCKQIFHEEGDGLSICHQDIRDYFAVLYINSVIRLMSGIVGTKNENCMAKLIQSTFKKLNENVFDKDAVPMIVQSWEDDLENRNGNILECLQKTIVNSSDATEIQLPVLMLLQFVARKFIDSIHNSKKKEKNHYCGFFKKTYSIVNDKVTGEKSVCNNKTVYESLSLEAEMLRRLQRYEESVSCSQKLIDITDDESYRRNGKNNKAKCLLYDAHDKALNNRGAYSSAIESLFTQSIDELKSNEYYLSANLFLLLLFNPDLVSKPYIEMILADDTENPEYAFSRVWEYATSEGKKDRYALIYSYQSLISCLAHGYVDVDRIDISKACPIIVKKNMNKRTMLFIDEKRLEAIKFLQDKFQDKEYTKNVHCFKGIYLLNTTSIADFNSYNDIIKEFEKSFAIDNSKEDPIIGSPMGLFIYTVLSKDLQEAERTGNLDEIWKFLNYRVHEVPPTESHSVDGYDSYYVLRDISSVWEEIKNQNDYLQISNDIREQIELKLAYYQEEYNMEKEKWKKW